MTTELVRRFEGTDPAPQRRSAGVSRRGVRRGAAETSQPVRDTSAGRLAGRITVTGRAVRGQEAQRVGVSFARRRCAWSGSASARWDRRNPGVRRAVPRDRRGSRARPNLSGGPTRHRLSRAGRQRRTQRALPRARPERTPLPQHLLRDFPAAVVQSWQYVVLAFLLIRFRRPSATVMIRERPALAEEIVSPVMVAARRGGVGAPGRGPQGTRRRGGRAARCRRAHHVQQHQRLVRHLFVGGLTGGLLTAWLLFTNGMMLGTGWGISELQRAGISADVRRGARRARADGDLHLGRRGVSLAKALIAPGDRTRMDALIVEGRIAAA
jgi:hypothetical protein